MGSELQIAVPDIGDFESVDVIDVLVKPGDIIKLEDPLVTLESEKATMDIPAPYAGKVISVTVKVGDKVSQGNPIILIEPLADGAPPIAPNPPTPAAKPEMATPLPSPPTAPVSPAPSQPNQYGFVSPDPGPRTLTPPAAGQELTASTAHVYASPAIRKFARELGVDLKVVTGSGRKGRLVKEDVTAFVKQALQSKPTAGAGSAFNVASAPVIDFSKFGATDTKPLSKIKRLTGVNLHRAWVTIPHVTQFDEADITDLEAFRKAHLEEAERHGGKLTLVAFVLKAVTAALVRFPDFNSSLADDGENLIYKQYFNVGVAVNTERGLVVPVVRDTLHKGIYALAKEIRELSVKARDGKLAPADMQGGCFTITSLGGVSGTGFTPIINPPEVAILGLSPAVMKPVYQNGAFVPRLMLPLSLSYDHRVIDGVAAAEFTRALRVSLSDLRELLM